MSRTKIHVEAGQITDDLPAFRSTTVNQKPLGFHALWPSRRDLCGTIAFLCTLCRSQQAKDTERRYERLNWQLSAGMARTSAADDSHHPFSRADGLLLAKFARYARTVAPAIARDSASIAANEFARPRIDMPCGPILDLVRATLMDTASRKHASNLNIVRTSGAVINFIRCRLHISHKLALFSMASSHKTSNTSPACSLLDLGALARLGNGCASLACCARIPRKQIVKTR